MRVPPGSEVMRPMRNPKAEVLKPLHSILTLLNKEIQANSGLGQIILKDPTSPTDQQVEYTLTWLPSVSF